MCRQMGLEQDCSLRDGFALKRRRKQVCCNSSLSRALLKRALCEAEGHSYPPHLHYFKYCVFMTTLLILNLGGLYIYHSDFLGINYLILTQPGYYENSVKDESEVRKESLFSNLPKGALWAGGGPGSKSPTWADGRSRDGHTHWSSQGDRRTGRSQGVLGHRQIRNVLGPSTLTEHTGVQIGTLQPRFSECTLYRFV